MLVYWLSPRKKFRRGKDSWPLADVTFITFFEMLEVKNVLGEGKSHLGGSSAEASVDRLSFKLKETLLKHQVRLLWFFL